MQILMVLVIIFIVFFAVFAISIGLRGSNTKKTHKGKKNIGKSREYILKEANRRLSINPKDPIALKTLGSLYYEEGAYKKAMQTYQLILTQSGTTQGLDESQLNLMYGLSALKCEVWDEAYKSLMIARAKEPNDLQVNAGLGKLEFMRKNYEKAIIFNKKALQIQSGHVEALKFMGQSLYKLKRYSEAIPYLKKEVATQPEDKESRYALARCQYEIPRHDLAQKTFRQLRTDPKWGPQSAFYSGTVYAKKRQWKEAIADYQTGLQHKTIPEELQLKLKYRLAEAFNQTQQIDRALPLLNEIHKTAPNYKDVASQIKRYQELSSNKNLQTYLMAPTNEFTMLCKKLAHASFPKARIKVNDINVQKSEYVDLLTDVKTNKWEDVVLFRFMRNESQLSELFVRDFYAHSKEMHAERGFCFTAGSFSEEAVRFVEARLIDLFDKPALIKKLKAIGSDPFTSSF